MLCARKQSWIFYYARYHFKKHEQVYQLVNIKQDILILIPSRKYKIFQSHLISLCEQRQVVVA